MNVYSVLKPDSYMDDIVSGSENKEAALQLIEHIKEIAAQGGFTFKDFVVSGDADGDMPESRCKIQRVLGLNWSPTDDSLVFSIKFNPHKKCKGQRQDYEKSPED